MSQEDYATVMKTLSGNLAENFEEDSLTPIESTESTSTTKTKKDEVEETERETAGKDGKSLKKLTQSELSTEPAKPEKRFVFSFKLDDITAFLYSGSSNLVSSFSRCDYLSVGIFLSNSSLLPLRVASQC